MPPILFRLAKSPVQIGFKPFLVPGLLTLFKPGFFWLSMTEGGGFHPPSRKQCYG